jgi:predicted esterase
VINEHHITTQRTARYYTMGEPGPEIVEVWFALHGYGQLAGRFVRELGALDNGSRLIVAPEALSRFYLGEAGKRTASERSIGASWMTREDRLTEIDDQMRYFDAVYGDALTGMDRSRARVCILGYSQGAAAAARWLARGTAGADRLILWGGEIPPDLDLSTERERLSRVEILLVAGTRDQFITRKILERETQRLEAHAIPFRLVTFEGGHEINEAVLRQLAG